MAHCHPLLMMQSVYQAPDEQIAAQPHAPEVVVLLAKVQQHPNSQQHGKGPTQVLAAVVVTQDNVYVGASMAHQVIKMLYSCWIPNT